MMDSLRGAANHIVLKVILVLIIISFVLMGVGNYLVGGGRNYAAKVNGDEISALELDRNVQQERTRQQQLLGDRFSQLAGNESYIKQLRADVLSQLIDQHLLTQYITKLHLAMSDEQVKQAILAMPMFRSGENFDNNKYLYILNQNGITPDQFAESTRRQLMSVQLAKGTGTSSFILPNEVDKQAALTTEQRIIRSATIDVAALAAKQQPTEQEISGYYQQHKDQFMTPELFQIAYVKMDTTNLPDKIAIDDAQIKAYYQQHQQEFGQEQQQRISIIQTDSQEKAQAILDQLKKGANFAELAKTSSQDLLSAKSGGDLGWLDSNSMPEELKKANLTNKGQLSGVIKSSVGYIVAKLDDIKPAQLTPLAQVSATIVKKLTQEKTLSAFYALQQKVSDAASNNNDSLQAVAQIPGLKVVQTDWFSKNTLPKELNYPAISQLIFNGKLLGNDGQPGSNSDVINLPDNIAYVLRIAGHKPSTLQPLSAVHAGVVTAIKQQKAQQQANEQAEKLLVALRQGKGDSLMKTDGLTFSVPITVKRSEATGLSQSVFALAAPAAGKPTYGQAIDDKGNVMVIELDKIQAGSISAADKTQQSQQWQQDIANIEMLSLLNQLRKSATIKYGVAADMPD